MARTPIWRLPPQEAKDEVRRRIAERWMSDPALACRKLDIESAQSLSWTDVAVFAAGAALIGLVLDGLSNFLPALAVWSVVGGGAAMVWAARAQGLLNRGDPGWIDALPPLARREAQDRLADRLEEISRFDPQNPSVASAEAFAEVVVEDLAITVRDSRERLVAELRKVRRWVEAMDATLADPGVDPERRSKIQSTVGGLRARQVQLENALHDLGETERTARRSVEDAVAAVREGRAGSDWRSLEAAAADLEERTSGLVRSAESHADPSRRILDLLRS